MINFSIMSIRYKYHERKAHTIIPAALASLFDDNNCFNSSGKLQYSNTNIEFRGL